MIKEIRTQTQVVLAHLIKHCTIDSRQARNLYGIERLAARVNDLRERYGRDIIRTEMVKGKNRHDHDVVFAMYHFCPELVDSEAAHNWIEKDDIEAEVQGEQAGDQ